MPRRLPVDRRSDTDGRRDGDYARGNRGRARPSAGGGAHSIERRAGGSGGFSGTSGFSRSGGFSSFDTLSESVEPAGRHLLNGRIDRDGLVDLPLGGAFVTARGAHPQMRLDAPAVGLAQALIDEPRKQLPNIPVFGGLRI